MADLEELHSILYADPEVAPSFAGKVYTAEETAQRIREKVWLNQHSGEQGWGYWSIVRREDDQLIGLVILGNPERIYWSTNLPNSYPEVPYVPLFTEIGYALGRRYWGNGYATEAARAVLEYAFRDLRVARFEIPWYQGPHNPRSFDVYRRLGFDVKGGVNVQDSDVLLTKDNHISGLTPLATLQPPDTDHSIDSDPVGLGTTGPNDLRSPVQLETDRLVLRGIRPEDIEPISVLTNEDTYHRSSFGRVHSFGVYDRVLRFAQESPVGARIRHGWAYDGLGSWAVVRKSDNSVIGHVSLGPAARTYWIASPGEADSPYARWEVDLACVLAASSRDQHYAREACEAMIEYAFREMKLARIVNHLSADDALSMGLAQSLGYSIEENLHSYYGGHVATLVNTLI